MSRHRLLDVAAQDFVRRQVADARELPEVAHPRFATAVPSSGSTSEPFQNPNTAWFLNAAVLQSIPVMKCRGIQLAPYIAELMNR